MKYTLKPRDQMTCEDWGKDLGVKVNQVTTHPDGTIEIETDEKEVKEATRTKLNAVNGMRLVG
jgi:hypothetical protein